MDSKRRNFMKALPLLAGLPLASIVVKDDLDTAMESGARKMLVVDPTVVNMDDLLSAHWPEHPEPKNRVPIVRINCEYWGKSGMVGGMMAVKL